MKQNLRKSLFFAVLFIPLLFLSCFSMQDVNFSPIDNCIENGDYVQAQLILDKQKAYYYTSHEKVLEYLDGGMLSHFANDFQKSNDFLSKAELEIEKNFTKSVTQQIGQTLVNDNVADYTGETYEDIYTNIFKCLNYIHLGNIEDAMVEIRRFDNKMKVVGSEYQSIIDSQKNTLSQDYSYTDIEVPDKTVEFHNSAFARYLSMLLYRTEKDYSSARIDYNKIQEAYALQKKVYGFNPPSELKDELELPSDGARINVITFTGLGPIKQEFVERIPFRNAYFKLALPVMTERQSGVYGVQVVMKNQSTKKEYVFNLHALENIEAIVKDTYQQHYSVIFSRTLIRAIGKSMRSGLLHAASKATSDTDYGILFSLLNLASQISTEASERADVRICRYFPGLVSVGGITVPEGKYDVQVNYYNKNKKKFFTYAVENFEAKKGKLNLVEAVCQK